jgi:hypothetical protein
LVHTLHLGGRLHAQLVVQLGAQRVEDAERFASPSGLAERVDEPGVEPLVVRVRRGQIFELPDQFAVPAELHVGLDAQLERVEPLLAQLYGVPGQDGTRVDIGHRLSPPHGQRTAQHARRLLEKAARQHRLGLLDPAGEDLAVDPFRIDLQHVAARLRDQPL